MISSDGNIVFDEKDFAVNRTLTKEIFGGSSMFNEVTKQDTYAYTSYYINPQKIDGKTFYISFMFAPNEKIYMVHLGLKIDGVIPFKQNWSEQVELKKKDSHDRWLKEILGNPPYDYDWGSISSTYDPRSGLSSITVCYKE